jgi:hypothetical protein
MTKTLDPDIEIAFTMQALEEEYISPEAVKPMQLALKSWSEAAEGDFVAIERQVTYNDSIISISPNTTLYTRRRNDLYQEVFQDIPTYQRRLLADAICLSGYGAGSHFTHARINKTAGGTIPKASEFRMLYLRDALIFKPEMPISYWEDHVSLIPQIPLRAQAMAGLGTILVMPTSGGGHARMRQWTAIQEAYDLYSAHWPFGRRNLNTVLVPQRPTEVQTEA